MRLIFFLCAILYAAACSAQSDVPQRINYQAIARNASGIALANQAISIKAEILDSDQTSILYAETHAVATNAFGLFTLSIGGGTVLNGNFSNISWGRGNKFIRTSADLAGGSNFQVMGTSQLLSVPYAFFALKADSAQQVSEAIRKAIKRQATIQYLNN